MRWLHLILVACTITVGVQSRSKSRSSRGRGDADKPPGSSTYWDQEYRTTRAVLRRYVGNPPIINSSIPVRVGHSLSLIALMGYTSFGHIVSFRAKVHQIWQDPRLVWDSKDAGNIDKLHINSDRIWTPETEVFPSVDNSKYFSGGKPDLIVTSRGGVKWTYDDTFRVPCTPKTTRSQHTCSFRVWTPNYQANEMVIVPISDVIKLTDYVTNSSAAITATQVKEELLTRVDEQFSVINYNFTYDISGWERT